MKNTRNDFVAFEKRYGVSIKIPNFEDSVFQERLMRFGAEFKTLKLEHPTDATTIGAIQDSFREDILHRERILVALGYSQEYISRFFSSWARG